MELRPEEITKIIKSQIKNYENHIVQEEVGTVLVVGDGIARASGLEKCMMNELLEFPNGEYGIAQNLEENTVAVIILGDDGGIKEGDTVRRTGRVVSVPVGEALIGRVVNALGAPIDGKGPVEAAGYAPVESPAPGIIERQPVTVPLQTGIKAIDSMIPIGRGQRELIIGDRQTGKTSIALDTILNQRGEDIICIYVAIGKTKKEVKDIYSQLLCRGAMEYTIIVAAFNDDCAPVLQSTPYAALSIAETYLREGKDVLVVLDDLKRHADVCREIALLMEKTPGRDAYPPDIFYAHSRMLELGCQHKNGGSITVLPICETKGGDITDFISTNIISITDGQIVLSAKNFEKGQKPAINYGLSVSRLGGAVQTAAIKKAGPPIRRELLAYLEQREVFELANADEMGEALRERMRRGAVILDMLKQHKFAVRTPEMMLEITGRLAGGGTQ